MELNLRFNGELWEYQGEAPWIFMTIPSELADEIDERVPQRGGFGSVKVVVSIGQSEWNTSLFPDRASDSFVLPVKKKIRVDENLAPGDRANVILRIDID